MNIQARFRLTQVNRAQSYYKASCSPEAAPVESAHVTLNAVQGEPFGAATPFGRIEMIIVNPPAAKVFFDAPIGQEFDLLFSPHAEAESEGSDGSL